jgi:GntR family transcriptional regulator
MFLSIEPDGPVPIYQQIRDRIVEAIAGGRQPAGSGLPSTRQLAVDLGVNFHTVNKSYDLLRREGLLRLSRKSGAVVQRDAGSGPPSPDWAGDWTARLDTLLAEAAAQGMPAEAIIAHCRSAVAEFAFPAATGDDAPGHGTAIAGRP